MRWKKYINSCIWLGYVFVIFPLLDANGQNQLDSLAIRDSVVLSPESQYTMLKRSDSLILPDFYDNWYQFMRHLEALRLGKDTVISIIHLGDSHIQAGHFSGRIMRLFHQEFGNAGRGWIAPFKLSHSNEPNDYFIKSAVKDWITGRCVQNVPKVKIGIGGIGIQTESPLINFDIIITPHNGAGYYFNKVVLYRDEKSAPMFPTGVYKDSVCLLRAKTIMDVGVIADTLYSKRLIDTLLLHGLYSDVERIGFGQDSSFKNIYYGFSLTNGRSGILYHAIGVNGAMYINYTHESYVRQLALLRPSLLILSLGTNETFGRQFNQAEFTLQVKDFISMVKREMPHTAILLTTPPECFRKVWIKKQRTYVRNVNTELVAQIIRMVAKEQGLACWDLFTITGGRNSCREWQKKNLLSRDRIHFTPRGYEEQANLLFRALMKSYNQR